MGTTRYDDFVRPMDPELVKDKINAAFGGIDPHDHAGAGRGGTIPGSAISGAVAEATHATNADTATNATHATSADSATNASYTNLLNSNAIAQQFDSSLIANGYQKLPSGLILQWGIEPNYHDAVDNYSAVFTFPIEFPTEVLMVCPRLETNGLNAGLSNLSYGPPTKSSVTIFIDEFNAQIQSFKLGYFAIGH